ncbi:MAG: ATP-binding cassette domain-containing protein, partial [Myxococcales bacterium]|nr:ATP-binding cassette domain-containing protein [Myxococcales bacterium]
MIRLTQVEKRYPGAAAGELALRKVSLQIDEGELVAIVGTSGSGKTTLLNLIGGLDRDYRGTVEVAGHNLAALNDRKMADFRNRHVGFVFQHFSLLDHLTALENVALPAAFLRGPAPISEDPVARARATLEEMGLGSKLGENPNNLSGG